jgi:8-oxo-dGTP pyrophosphatase MutT (NUDIX family)
LRNEIAESLSLVSPLDLSQKLQNYACVALILRGPYDNLEIGFIQRALHPNDRWGGHIAFPGGKKEDADVSDLGTALRETFEEVGIDLLPEELIGRLDDVQARKHGTMLDFFIRPFVFYTEREFKVNLDQNEVADFFWIALNDLRNPQRQTQYELKRDEVFIKLPAISVDRDPPLWGLTYMMTQNLLKHLAK